MASRNRRQEIMGVGYAYAFLPAQKTEKIVQNILEKPSCCIGLYLPLWAINHAHSRNWFRSALFSLRAL
jgi:hypothetical protein